MPYLRPENGLPVSVFLSFLRTQPNMKITGKILEVKDTQQVSDSFKKRSFIVEYAENPQYPEYISFELIQDRCSLLDGFQAGQEVEVSFNLKGRKWVNPEGETKYFNSLQAWRIDEATSSSSSSGMATSTPQSPDTSSTTNEENDLPF